MATIYRTTSIERRDFRGRAFVVVVFVVVASFSASRSSYAIEEARDLDAYAQLKANDCTLPRSSTRWIFRLVLDVRRRPKGDTSVRYYHS